VADPGFASGREGADHSERAEREPITGVWERRSRGRALVRGY